MKIRAKQSGLSLVETIVVVAVVALMIGLAIPAVKTFTNSTSSSAGAESMISAALSSARSIAAKNQKYAGIRFQRDKDGYQYMIAIIHNYDPSAASGLNKSVDSFTAVKGLNPVKLPENILVFDTKDYNDVEINASAVNDDDKLKDITSFTILFSPSGSLATRMVLVSPISANDSIFNSSATVEYMFEKSVNSSAKPYGKELSRNSLILCGNKADFLKLATGERWTDFFEDPANAGKPDPAKTFYINPYTGSIISEK